MGQGGSGACCVAQDKTPVCLEESDSGEAAVSTARALRTPVRTPTRTPRTARTQSFPSPEEKPSMDTVNAALAAVTESLSRLAENHPDIDLAEPSVCSESREEELEAALAAATARIHKLEAQIAVPARRSPSGQAAGEPG